MKFPFLVFSASLLLAAMSPAADPPVEVGRVAWKDDLDAGMKLAGKEGKPVFLLFQEVPG